MIGDWEDLAFDNDSNHKEYNELKAWLRSQTQDSRITVTPSSYPAPVLCAALLAATYEIRDNLDEQIALLVKEAGDHNIQVRQGDYYKTRADDWDGMIYDDVDEMSAQECVGLLWAAKEEISWLHNEISRLEIYVSVEKQMENSGLKKRKTILRPLKRKNAKQRDESPRTRGTAQSGGVDSGSGFSPRSPPADRMIARGDVEGLKW